MDTERLTFPNIMLKSLYMDTAVEPNRNLNKRKQQNLDNIIFSLKTEV